MLFMLLSTVITLHERSMNLSGIKLIHISAWYIIPIVLTTLLSDFMLTFAFKKNIGMEEIPFSVDDISQIRKVERRMPILYEEQRKSSGIQAISKLEEYRGFLHIFHVPYIVCFYAAKGKWPFIPYTMQSRVDVTARSFFSQNDSIIKQICHKWIQVKECFRPIFGPTTLAPDTEAVALARGTPSTCAKLTSTESPDPIVYFDKDHIGSVGSETIRNTIEFLENFLPTPTKPPKRKNRVRSRVDEMEIK